jgi:hypothetical protein
VTFGRSGHTPADSIEINGGTYPSCGAGTEPTYYTASKTYSKGTELLPPPSDESLGSYVESSDRLKGATHLSMNGATSEITVWNVVNGAVANTKTIAWPANGLLYVEASGACGYVYNAKEADTSTDEKEEEKCGNVWVEGTYSKPLTIAATDDVIIHGDVYPTSVAGKLGSAPSGIPALGLIATNFVRVYHPCASGTNKAGVLENPWIYAAILSTSHSFLVDNWECGKGLGSLGVYGAIAQKFRGPVGTTAGASAYLKDYVYDSRLATEEPPYFLSPFKTGWKVSRETSPTAG